VSASQRRRGAAGELEVVRLCREAGFPASRNLNQPRDGGADIVGIAGVAIEVKRTERADVWSWWQQAEGNAGPTNLPIVAFRRDSSSWLAVTDFAELLALIRHRARA
jgi:hypothetical protein